MGYTFTEIPRGLSEIFFRKGTSEFFRFLVLFIIEGS